MHAIVADRAAATGLLSAAEDSRLRPAAAPAAAPPPPVRGTATATSDAGAFSDQATRGTRTDERGSEVEEGSNAAGGAEEAAVEAARGAERVAEAVGEALAKAEEGEQRAARRVGAGAEGRERHAVGGEGEGWVGVGLPAAGGGVAAQAVREEEEGEEGEDGRHPQLQGRREREHERVWEKADAERVEAEVAADSPRAGGGEEGGGGGGGGAGGLRALGARLRDVFKSPGKGGRGRSCGGSGEEVRLSVRCWGLMRESALALSGAVVRCMLNAERMHAARQHLGLTHQLSSSTHTSTYTHTRTPQRRPSGSTTDEPLVFSSSAPSPLTSTPAAGPPASEQLPLHHGASREARHVGFAVAEEAERAQAPPQLPLPKGPLEPYEEPAAEPAMVGAPAPPSAASPFAAPAPAPAAASVPTAPPATAPSAGAEAEAAVPAGGLAAHPQPPATHLPAARHAMDLHQSAGSGEPGPPHAPAREDRAFAPLRPVEDDEGRLARPRVWLMSEEERRRQQATRGGEEGRAGLGGAGGGALAPAGVEAAVPVVAAIQKQLAGR